MIIITRTINRAITTMSDETIVLVTIQLIIVMIPITSFTTTSTRNSIITSGDKYRKITIGNLVNTNNNRTLSIWSSMITLKDSYVKTTIAELIEIPNGETTTAPIEIYTIISNIINISE